MMFLTHLRPARIDDCPDIHSAHQYSVRYACEHYYNEEILQAWLDRLSMNSYIEAIQTRTMWVIEYKNHIQGFFQLNLPRAELDALYVHPFVHRQGLGTAMLQKAEQIAFNSGLGMLKLYASLNSVRFVRKPRHVRRLLRTERHAEPPGCPQPPRCRSRTRRQV
ncbi:MAG: GNAT family N-acetyltransferase [Neisseriaceae bacterium]|nr:GNAT family N-acetyltransferase [Neisseriaceae bacterium]